MMSMRLAAVEAHPLCLLLRHPIPLNLGMVEEMLASRGVIVSDETVRQWTPKFGQALANRIRRRLPQAGDKWYFDEVPIKIVGSPTTSTAPRG